MTFFHQHNAADEATQLDLGGLAAVGRSPARHPGRTGRDRHALRRFFQAKRLFDIFISVFSIPLLVLVAGILLLLNPLCNPGPLVYSQMRMGRRCRPFRIYKFRTMLEAPRIGRGPLDPVEADRITRFGRLLRRTRIDELPQLANVLIGQMSLVGPRPDFWEHATYYVETIPGYRRRHLVRPGITGLAQVDGGYAEGLPAIAKKTMHDLRYIRNIGHRMEWHVLCRTVVVVLTGFGAK